MRLSCNDCEDVEAAAEADESMSMNWDPWDDQLPERDKEYEDQYDHVPEHVRDSYRDDLDEMDYQIDQTIEKEDNE